MQGIRQYSDNKFGRSLLSINFKLNITQFLTIQRAQVIMLTSITVAIPNSIVRCSQQIQLLSYCSKITTRIAQDADSVAHEIPLGFHDGLCLRAVERRAVEYQVRQYHGGTLIQSSFRRPTSEKHNCSEPRLPQQCLKNPHLPFYHTNSCSETLKFWRSGGNPDNGTAGCSPSDEVHGTWRVWAWMREGRSQCQSHSNLGFGKT